jgi:hypothetical protein
MQPASVRLAKWVILMILMLTSLCAVATRDQQQQRGGGGRRLVLQAGRSGQRQRAKGRRPPPSVRLNVGALCDDANYFTCLQDNDGINGKVPLLTLLRELVHVCLSKSSPRLCQSGLFALQDTIRRP